MENQNSDMLTTKEAARILNVKPTTIHKYVREGKLKPVYTDGWQIDATKLFYTADIEALKKELQKPGITTGEAADLLGIHITTISQYIQKGIIKAGKKLYRGREIYFIEPEEIERFKSVYDQKKKREQKNFFDKETGFAWFQSFIDSKGNSNNRILPNDEGEPYLNTEDGKQIHIDKVLLLGFQPVFQIPDIDYISKRGYAKFKFSISENFYSIITYFYKYLGPKNMKVAVNEDQSITVEVKPFFLREQLNSEEIKELNKSLVEGSIICRYDGILVNSDLETITVAVPADLKDLVKKEAERTGHTIEEIVLDSLKEKFNYK
ncbi:MULTISPECIES: helix-turn-helix domain-containing protein [Bacillota]|uniref:helix-turn-helix domain-containing protein n=1 Tax=Bacillota TaxID=1239 RepID=UPI0039EF829A